MRNGWLAFALLLAACVGAAVRPVVFPAASAAAPSERCDWRYLSDAGEPEIPTAAGRGVMDEEWTALSAAGFRLASEGPQAAPAVYVFERCTPTQ